MRLRTEELNTKERQVVAQTIYNYLTETIKLDLSGKFMEIKECKRQMIYLFNYHAKGVLTKTEKAHSLKILVEPFLLVEKKAEGRNKLSNLKNLR